MNNIIYNNEIQDGDNPVVAITRDQWTKQATTIVRDLETYLYNMVFNHGFGTVKLYVTESKDEDVSKFAPIATIEYGRKFVTKFLGGQRNEYNHPDDCASEIVKKIATFLT